MNSWLFNADTGVLEDPVNKLTEFDDIWTVIQAYRDRFRLHPTQLLCKPLNYGLHLPTVLYSPTLAQKEVAENYLQDEVRTLIRTNNFFNGGGEGLPNATTAQERPFHSVVEAEEEIEEKGYRNQNNTDNCSIITTNQQNPTTLSTTTTAAGSHPAVKGHLRKFPAGSRDTGREDPSSNQQRYQAVIAQLNGRKQEEQSNLFLLNNDDHSHHRQQGQRLNLSDDHQHPHSENIDHHSPRNTINYQSTSTSTPKLQALLLKQCQQQSPKTTSPPLTSPHQQQVTNSTRRKTKKAVNGKTGNLSRNNSVKSGTKRRKLNSTASSGRQQDRQGTVASSSAVVDLPKLTRIDDLQAIQRERQLQSLIQDRPSSASPSPPNATNSHSSSAAEAFLNISKKSKTGAKKMFREFEMGREVERLMSAAILPKHTQKPSSSKDRLKPFENSLDTISNGFKAATKKLLKGIDGETNGDEGTRGKLGTTGAIINNKTRSPTNLKKKTTETTITSPDVWPPSSGDKTGSILKNSLPYTADNVFINRPIAVWGRCEVINWLQSVSFKRHIPMDRLMALIKMTGQQLVQLSERQILDFDPLYGSMLYRDLYAIRLSQKRLSKPPPEAAFRTPAESIIFKQSSSTSCSLTATTKPSITKGTVSTAEQY